MATAAYAVVLALTTTRTALVLDAVCFRSSPVARVARAMTTRGLSQVLPSTSPRQRPPSAGGSRVRTLHKRLLAMHFIAIANMSAGCAKYMLDVSELSCLATRRAMVATILLYDASLVLFLLGKTSVTNGNRALAIWEACITWWSRFYGWVVLTTGAVFLASQVSSVPSPEGTFCLALDLQEDEDVTFSDTLGFVINNGILIIQFVLLLTMFVKPLMIPQGHTQSGGAVYRRLVMRNVACTIGITFTYAVTTVIVVLGFLTTAPGSIKAAQLADLLPTANIFVTLCLTEISLPLGFSSCVRSIKAETSSVLDSERHQTVKGDQPMLMAQSGDIGTGLGSGEPQEAGESADFPIEIT
ncbi:unnamed protein product [Ectocarpus sp. 12 AP-2014]